MWHVCLCGYCLPGAIIVCLNNTDLGMANRLCNYVIMIVYLPFLVAAYGFCLFRPLNGNGRFSLRSCVVFYAERFGGSGPHFKLEKTSGLN